MWHSRCADINVTGTFVLWSYLMGTRKPKLEAHEQTWITASFSPVEEARWTSSINKFRKRVRKPRGPGYICSLVWEVPNIRQTERERKRDIVIAALVVSVWKFRFVQPRSRKLQSLGQTDVLFVWQIVDIFSHTRDKISIRTEKNMNHLNRNWFLVC